MTNAAPTTSTIIPCLRYRDALAAIDWLCRAFGFEKHAVYADGDTVHHAQLTFGNRSEEHTSELQSLMRTSYAVFCLKKKTTTDNQYNNTRRIQRDTKHNNRENTI